MALVLIGAGCSHRHQLPLPAAPLTPPTRLCAAPESFGGGSCRPPREIENLLDAAPVMLGMVDPPTGSQGAKILTLKANGPRGSSVFRAKWRPQSSADLINEPRKELAAYAVQRLFLSDGELVSPPTVAHCFPLEDYRQFAPGERATFGVADCVLGFASYWLEEVQSVSAARRVGTLGSGDGVWDAARFDRDTLYRESVAKTNLLMFLIKHGDAHDDQFLLEVTPKGARAFVVDNSIAFLSIANPMLLFRKDWSNIHVPWLPRRAIERLRQLTEEDYARLAVVAELELKDRQLVTPSELERAPTDGTAMSWHGRRLRFGLTSKEIELVRSQVSTLLARPDLARLTAR
ncbi:MAG: hypothetical protein ABIQ16_14130 [Polyangiaceae bacterium]